MTNDAGAGPEPLIGGNLLNEQENVLEAMKHRKPAEKKGAERPEHGNPDEREPNQEHRLPGGGDAIPTEAADNIAAQQGTQGGGAVPPGSAGEGNAKPHE